LDAPILIDYRRLSMEVDRRSAEVWASWFRCLGDPSRVLLLNRLAVAARPMTVGELVELVDIGQPTVSHHLKVLAQAGFVTCEPKANTSLYAVNHLCLERFPSAAELIMGVLPRYEPHGPDCLAPWQANDGASVAPSAARREKSVHA
jgi:ArsR family transcriptional regulator